MTEKPRPTESLIVDEGYQGRLAMIPTVVANLGLSPHEFVLYLQFILMASTPGILSGDDEQIALRCHITTEELDEAYQGLIDKGLIEVAKKPGAVDTETVTIVDLSERNIEFCEGSPAWA